MAINILKNTAYHNLTYAKNRLIRYIIIHYTAGTRSTPGSAWNTCEWFKNADANGSADYSVDDQFMVQYNPNPENYYCWAIGGAKYSKMSTSLGGKYHNIATNKNSISIELCSNKKNSRTLGDYDTDWYLTEATIKNAVELTKYLMKKYNIPLQNVIMHHQVTGKLCPQPWVINEAALSGWRDFLSRVSDNKPKPEEPEIIETTCKIAINGKVKTYKTKLVKGSNYVHARSFITDLGYEVGFNDEKKRVTVDNKLTLDISTIIDNNTSYINLRECIDFLNQYDTWKYIQDKTIRYNDATKVIGIY